MIECLKYKPVNKGAIQGVADFKIVKWNLEIRGCAIFMKNGRRWINMPNKEFETPEGGKGYAPFVKFTDSSMMDRFTTEALKSLDKYCAENSPSVFEQEESIQEDLPF